MNPSASAGLSGSDQTLPPGTRLAEFEIRRVIGVGGFGIVYLAFDHHLQREVAIKEYMPGQFAGRDATGAVTVRVHTHAEVFGAGLRSFVNEARLLARFDHPALLKVYRFWEANGTAYMVMPFYEGRTLAQVVKDMPAPPAQDWLMQVIEPLLGALELLHGQQIYHRDISPDNILLQRDGRPVLLDFGAARRVIGDRTQNLTAILKPNYAPIEQYAEIPGLKQGPWTDLYALGAVVHACLTGKPPSPAATRGVMDDLVPLTRIGEQLRQRHRLVYDPNFLTAWQAALAVRPAERLQSVSDLRAALAGRATAPARPTVTAPIPVPAVATRIPPPAIDDEADPDRTVIVRARPATSAAPAPVAPAPMPAPAPGGSGSRHRIGLFVGVGGLVLAGAGYLAWRGGAPAPAASPVVPAVAASSPDNPASRPELANVPVAAPLPVGGVPASAAAEPLPAAAPASAAAPAPQAAPVPAARASMPPPPPLASAASVRKPPAPVSRSRPAEAPTPATTPPIPAPAPVPVPVPAPMPSPKPDVAKPAPVPAPAPAASGPTSASEACGARSPLALWRCMERECRNPRFRAQKDCELHAKEEVRP